MTELLFFSPLTFREQRLSGSAVRPVKMAEAFEDIGAAVTHCTGPSWRRKQVWAEVFARRPDIAGVYAELSTMPLALTDPDHLPRAPLMDGRAFRRCRALGWPVAAFYRDIYWTFPQYRAETAFWKRAVTFPFYHLELRQLRRCIDHLFLPSVTMLDHIPGGFPRERVSALPPGGSWHDDASQREVQQDGMLYLLYVGGIEPPLYDLSGVLRAVDRLSGVTLTLCCRESEWVRYRRLYSGTRGVEVVHASGAGLEELYGRADVFIMSFESTEYRAFAMPVKLFEAIGAGLPIIASSNSAAGRFVLAEKIGWAVNPGEELIALLSHLVRQRDELVAVRKQVRRVRERHTWQGRAREVMKVFDSYRRAPLQT